MPQTIPLLLDTDIGSDIDDAVCLAYLLAERRCHLLGVSTVTGEAQKRAMLADALCRAAGREDIPVWSGAEEPVLGDQRQARAPQAEVLDCWDHETEFAANRAVWMLRETIREYPGEVTLITIGPLTNVGLLFALDREVPRMLRRLIVMGGSFFAQDRREWNVSCDPYASAVVLSSGVQDVRIYGLDVTTQCRLGAEECRERFHGGALDLVGQMAEVWFRQRDAITFHDPLAACCCFEPEICTYRSGIVEVEVNDPMLLGRTTLREIDGGPHRVAQEVNVDQFFTSYFDTAEALK